MILILAAVYVWAEVVRSPADNSVQLFFFDVGQGDAILIQKGNEQILVDGGPDDQVLSKLGKVMPLSDRKIETVILTHPHADHLAGLNQVLDRYEIGIIYFSGAVYTTNGYLEFLQKIKDKNIAAKVPLIGDNIIPFTDGKLTFLWPGDKYKEQTPENMNNASIVSRFCYFTECVLLTGDIEIDEQASMFQSCRSEQSEESRQREGIQHSVASVQGEAKNTTTPNPSSERRGESCDFQAQILKLPHHGSTNGTNALLLDTVKPDYAVIQVGVDNKFGHPHGQVIDLLNSKNIPIDRTDRDGSIEFILSKDGIVIKK